MNRPTLALIPVLMLASCDAEKTATVEASAPANSYQLKTVDHDGHKFVCTTMSGVSTYSGITHHPGCPCLKKGETP